MSNSTPDPIAAARAAYRIGLIDSMLHPDNVDKIPGIFREQMTNERAHRLRELRQAGAEDALKEWRI